MQTLFKVSNNGRSIDGMRRAPSLIMLRRSYTPDLNGSLNFSPIIIFIDSLI
jgi:hypothetical protein